MLGQGSSGQVVLVDQEETKWLREHCMVSFHNAVKKVFFLPGTEALAEYYFGRFLSQRFPNLFVRPLLLIHALDCVRYDAETQNHYVLYMEQEPLISDLPGLYDPSQMEEAFIQLASASSSCGIIHNDIHLHNLFLDAKSVKLYDFGKASFDFLLDQSLGKNFCTLFNAPELWKRSNYTYVDNASDLWSIGLCLLSLSHPSLFSFMYK